MAGPRRRKARIRRRKRKPYELQSGGAVVRRSGPSLTDKIAFGASQFLAGPAPSFASIGKVLALQAYKGVEDNVRHSGFLC